MPIARHEEVCVTAERQRDEVVVVRIVGNDPWRIDGIVERDSVLTEPADEGLDRIGLCLHRIEPPPARDAFQLVLAVVLELETRSCHQIDDRA